MFLLALCLSSCTKKIEVKEHSERWHHCEARLHDIPFIINAKPIHHYSTRNDADDIVQLGYFSATSAEQIIEFYQQEMERLGWLQIGIVRGYEMLMHFEKPRRFCSISIRKDEQKRRTIVVISIGFKG